MSQNNIDYGSFPDDPSADAIRTAFTKVQNNFTQLFAANANSAVTSINRTPGAGITVNNPTGNVIISANIACVKISTSSLSVGIGGNGGTNATMVTSAQTLVIDIDPAQVLSNYFASPSNGLAVFNGTLSSNSNAQSNITSLGTLLNLGVAGNITTSNLSITGTSNLGNSTTANYFIGSGNNLSNIQGANVTGAVAYATTANSVAVANVSGIGNIATINLDGNVSNVLRGNGSWGVYTTGPIAGSNTQVIFNDAGSANGSANLTFDKTTSVLTVTGNVNAANVTTTSYFLRSVETGITASGTVQSTATAITKEINVVSTVASGAGVVLPTAVAGMVITITNTSANSLLVYPAANGIINSLSANAALTQVTNATLQFVAPTTTQWYTTSA